MDLLNASRVVGVLFTELSRASLDAVVGVVDILGEKIRSAMPLGCDSAREYVSGVLQ